MVFCGKGITTSHLARKILNGMRWQERFLLLVGTLLRSRTRGLHLNGGPKGGGGKQNPILALRPCYRT